MASYRSGQKILKMSLGYLDHKVWTYLKKKKEKDEDVSKPTERAPNGQIYNTLSNKINDIGL